MQIFFHLTRNTFRECLRKPVFFLILSASLLLTGLFPAATLFVFRNQLWMVLDSAIALTLLAGFASAVLCASHCIRGEMANGTVPLLLSKPVSRFSFILAKIAGINAALMVFAFLCMTATLIAGLIASDPFRFDITGMLLYFSAIAAACLYGALRNYYSHAPFYSNCIAAMLVLLPLYALYFYLQRRAFMIRAGAAADPNSFIWFTELLPALLLVFAALWIMGAIASALATRFSFLTNLLFCLILFLSGLFSGPLLTSLFADHPLLRALSGALIPNWQYFWMGDPLSDRTPIPGDYVALAALYAFLYSLLWSAWAAAAFQNTEPAKDTSV